MSDKYINIFFVIFVVVVLALYTWYSWSVANSDLPEWFKFWLLK